MNSFIRSKCSCVCKCRERLPGRPGIALPFYKHLMLVATAMPYLYYTKYFLNIVFFLVFNNIYRGLGIVRSL